MKINLNPAVLRSGPAKRVIFFYPGEEATYIENVDVVLYRNGIVQIRSKSEDTTTHLQNCEIIWRFEANENPKLRVLKLQRQAERPQN